jgi:MerR family copper efflux transcriptional regulator
MSESRPLTIGAVARAARVPLDTIRYYERRGLLPVPPRTAAGYRLYPADVVPRIRFVKSAQSLGFTLEEITELLELRVRPGASCDAVERRAEAAIDRIDAKLAELARMRGALSRLAANCRTPHTADECPMLTALEPRDTPPSISEAEAPSTANAPDDHARPPNR